jgi:hypothetical protein
MEHNPADLSDLIDAILVHILQLETNLKPT